MDFMTGLPISINWKKDSYNYLLVIVDWLIKMVDYKLVKITIDILGLVKVMIDVVVHYYDFLDSNVTDKSLFFTLKFWSLFCYFFGIK